MTRLQSSDFYLCCLSKPCKERLACALRWGRREGTWRRRKLPLTARSAHMVRVTSKNHPLVPKNLPVLCRLTLLASIRIYWNCKEVLTVKSAPTEHSESIDKLKAHRRTKIEWVLGEVPAVVFPGGAHLSRHACQHLPFMQAKCQGEELSRHIGNGLAMCAHILQPWHRLRRGSVNACLRWTRHACRRHFGPCSHNGDGARKCQGWSETDSPCVQATLRALRPLQRLWPGRRTWRRTRTRWPLQPSS